MTTALASLFDPAPALVFMDCDGIIYDVNALKCDAFGYALEPFPDEPVAELIAWHKATGGVSRYIKLRRFFEELHPVADVEDQLERALARYGEYSKAGYGRLSPRPEALAFAARLGGPERVYVVSGSAEGELRGIFDAAGIRDRFAEVCGSPTDKRAHLARILDERGVEPARALFIGDGWGDWDVATHHGVPFLFLSEMSEWSEGAEHVARTPGAVHAATWAEVIAALP